MTDRLLARLDAMDTRLQNIERQMVRKSDLFPTILAAQLCVWTIAGLVLFLAL